MMCPSCSNQLPPVEAQERVPDTIRRLLDDKSREGNMRSIPPVFSPSDARPLIDLMSNDYLGLRLQTGNGDFDSLRSECLSHQDMTSSASRLLCRRQEEYVRLEELLEKEYGRPALLFNSGYHANVGIVSALNVGRTLFIVDRLVHASVYDGLAAGRCKFERFRHNDMGHLERLLLKHSDEYDQLVVVVESVYSMDGDSAPLPDLARIRSRYPKMMLYVDEAHGVGVMGQRGLGLSEATGTIPYIDILVGTFGKALASAGAFAVTGEEMKLFLINCARSFIFSTALSPSTVAWSRLMFTKSLTMQRERQHLAEMSKWFNDELSDILGHPTGSTSQIVPFVTGSAHSANLLAAKVRGAGFDALPIRRPTVPPGGERLRFSLSAALRQDDLLPLVDVLRNHMTTTFDD